MTEVELLNPRGQRLLCSFFQPLPREVWSKSRDAASATAAENSHFSVSRIFHFYQPYHYLQFVIPLEFYGVELRFRLPLLSRNERQIKVGTRGRPEWLPSGPGTRSFCRPPFGRDSRGSGASPAKIWRTRTAAKPFNLRCTSSCSRHRFWGSDQSDSPTARDSLWTWPPFGPDYLWCRPEQVSRVDPEKVHRKVLQKSPAGAQKDSRPLLGVGPDDTQNRSRA